MANEGDINTASTINVFLDCLKKHRKGKKPQDGNEEMLPDPTQSEALHSHPPLNTEPSYNELFKEVIDLNARK